MAARPGLQVALAAGGAGVPGALVEADVLVLDPGDRRPEAALGALAGRTSPAPGRARERCRGPRPLASSDARGRARGSAPGRHGGRDRGRGRGRGGRAGRPARLRGARPGAAGSRREPARGRWRRPAHPPRARGARDDGRGHGQPRHRQSISASRPTPSSSTSPPSWTSSGARPRRGGGRRHPVGAAHGVIWVDGAPRHAKSWDRSTNSAEIAVPPGRRRPHRSSPGATFR